MTAPGPSGPHSDVLTGAPSAGPEPATTAATVPPATVRRARTLDGVPLRVRLVAGLLVLAALGLAVTGTASVLVLRNYLLGRVDTQLHSVAYSVAGTGRVPSNGGPPSTYYLRVSDATGRTLFTSNRVLPGQKPPQLPSWTTTQANGHLRTPFTVADTAGTGRWRVVALPVPLQEGGDGTILVAVNIDDTTNTVHRLAAIDVLGSVGVLLLLGVLAYWLVHSSLRPLRDVERTAGVIAAGDLSQRVSSDDERTEVGRLGSAFNTMVARIEQAFGAQAASEAQAVASAEQAQHSAEHARHSAEQAQRSEERMRRFVADASHELRTPLTSIRGFAELYRQGAVSQPEDVARVMSRIEGEGTRMSVLVDDLLLLARLDQQRPVEHGPVDLRHLVADAAQDAEAVAPDRTITAETPGEPVVVSGDDARLRQVLGNLVGNALRYTPETAAIALRLSVERGSAVLQVADDGPGMSEADAARAFERFYRADTARSRAQGGSGLGLSIVASLTQAHGGSYDLTTAPGEGATFTIRLPLTSSTP